MGTVSENQQAWGHYDWSHGGDEWSHAWGGTESLWWTTIFPRIRRFVPAPRILEIAPGFGRCTQYLKEVCDELVVVDLADRCIDACKERFRAESHIRYHVNDGQSLDAIADGSIDFVFSYDSLVHAESDVLRAYLSQLGRKLAPDGAGFFHHSNLGSFRDSATGELRVENPHWRAQTMTARAFIAFCDEAGLSCVSQELVAWGGEVLNDCFSSFTRNGSVFVRPYESWENRGFMDEANRAQQLSRVYGLGESPPLRGAQSLSGGAPTAPLLQLRRGILNRLRAFARGSM